jgi:hypothetical protein
VGHWFQPIISYGLIFPVFSVCFRFFVGLVNWAIYRLFYGIFKPENGAEAGPGNGMNAYPAIVYFPSLPYLIPFKFWDSRKNREQ